MLVELFDGLCGLDAAVGDEEGEQCLEKRHDADDACEVEGGLGGGDEDVFGGEGGGCRAAVGDGDDGDAPIGRETRGLDDLGAVGGEGHREVDVTGTHTGHVVDREAVVGGEGAEARQRHRAHVAEVSGEGRQGTDAEHAGVVGVEDGVGDHLEFGGVEVVEGLFDDVEVRGGQVGEQLTVVLGLGDGLEPAGLIGEGGAGPCHIAAEWLPEVVVALEADRTGEAHEGVGLDARLVGQLAHREHRHAPRLVEDVACGQPDLWTEVGIRLGESIEDLGWGGGCHRGTNVP